MAAFQKKANAVIILLLNPGYSPKTYQYNYPPAKARGNSKKGIFEKLKKSAAESNDYFKNEYRLE